MGLGKAPFKTSRTISSSYKNHLPTAVAILPSERIVGVNSLSLGFSVLDGRPNLRPVSTALESLI
jgi:hypothetical protein